MRAPVRGHVMSWVKSAVAPRIFVKTGAQRRGVEKLTSLPFTQCHAARRVAAMGGGPIYCSLRFAHVRDVTAARSRTPRSLAQGRRVVLASEGGKPQSIDEDRRMPDSSPTPSISSRISSPCEPSLEFLAQRRRMISTVVLATDQILTLASR